MALLIPKGKRNSENKLYLNEEPYYVYSTLKELARLCNCRGNFAKIWPKIESQFQIKRGNISHKKVNKELRAAKRRLQLAAEKGLKGAQKRWHSHSTTNTSANASAIANEKRNVIEETESKELRIRKGSISPLHCLVSSSSLRLENTSPSLAAKMLSFNESLRQLIKPRSQSDRTSFRNIGNWLTVKIEAEQFSEQIIPRVLEYAAEAVKGRSRNPAAVFTAILKKELNYQP